MDFLKNLSINLKATGPSAVLIVWLICLTVIGLYGNSSSASYVIGGLIGFGVIFIGALGSNGLE